MRRRPWVLVVALLILAIGFSIVVGIRYINRSNRLRNELLSAFSDLPGTLTIGGATLKSSTLQLSNVQFISADSLLNVDIRRVSLRLALSNLIRYSGGVNRIIQSAVVSDPHVVLRADRLKGIRDARLQPPDLTEYTFLERIILRDGSFSMQDADGVQWAGVAGIDGWLMAAPNERMRFELAARLFEDSLRSLAVKGAFELRNLHLESRMDIEAFHLAGFQFPPGFPLSELDGTFDFHSRIAYDSSGFNLNANWSIKEGAFQVYRGPLIEGVELSGLYEGGMATMSGKLLFDGDRSDLICSAEIGDSLQLAAELHIPNARLGDHLGKLIHLKKPFRPGGRIDARFQYQLAGVGDWTLTAHGTSDRLTTKIGSFDNVVTSLHLDRVNRSIVFESLTATWYGLSANAVARYNWDNEDRFPIDIEVSGVVSPEGLPEWTEPLSRKQVDGEVTLRLTRETGWVIQTEGRVRNVGEPDLGEFTGIYHQKAYDLRLNLYSSEYEDASARMWSQSGSDVQLATHRPQLIAAWWSPEMDTPDAIKRMDVSTGNRLRHGIITGGIDIVDEATGFSLDVDGTIRQADSTRFDGALGYTLRRDGTLIGNGDAYFNYNEGNLEIDRFTLMDFLHASGSVDLLEREIARFVLYVDDLNVADLLPAVTSIPQDKAGGRINGRFDVSGPFQQPNIHSHFELAEGRYGDLEQYWGLLTVESEIDGRVVIRDGSVGHGGRTLLTLTGGYDIPKRNMDIAIVSPGSDARILSQALTGREHLLQGTISLVGRIHGPLTLPSWSMNLAMLDARVLGIRFASANLTLRGETSRRLGHVLYIDEFDLNRPDRYRFQAFGAAPLTRGAGQLSFILDGDLPELLPQMHSFVTAGEGQGELSWTVTMVAGKPASSQGKLKLTNSSLAFESLLPAMRNIEIDIDVDVDGRTHINQFDARLGPAGRRIQVRNELVDGSDPAKLPIRLKTMGLDLGVLKARTPDSEGIPFRIPWISETSEFSNVKLNGPGSDPWFQVSGPIDSLLVRGGVTVSNAVLTIPEKPVGRNGFRSAGGAVAFARRNLRELVLAARWNTELHIGRDVRFDYMMGGLDEINLLSAFSNLIGQVSVDLVLESTEVSRPLRMTGRFEDDSFRLNGTISSTQGEIEFLDLSFEMQRAEVTFDQTSLLPVVSARSVSNIIEPGTEFSRRVYLTLYVIDPVTGERTLRGRWGDFVLILEDEEGSSQEQVATTLGISPTALRDRATALGAGGLEKAVTRRWLRPIERDVERWLGLDLVRFDPTIAQNLTIDPTSQTTPVADSVQGKGRQPVDYFRASSVTVGKYLTRDLFVSYTGQLGKDPRYTSYEEYQSGRIGLLQTWSLQYRLTDLSPNFVIQGDWEYDNLADVQAVEGRNNKQNNRSVRLKYTFLFDASKLRKP